MVRGRTGIVVGFGSVGRRHARTLTGLTKDLAIVEAKPRARAEALAAHPGAAVVERLDELDGMVRDWSGSLAVIATWGPSHASLFHALADRGGRRILCEKPLAASLCDACDMVTRAEREGIALGVHHYIRHARLGPALRRCFAEYALGEPVAIIVQGGAACLVTNGIHWLDFAIELFGIPPSRVISTGRADPINPRSPELGLYGGTATWTFPGGREAVISFSNASSIALSARIYLRNAYVDLDGDLNVRVWRRDPGAVERFPAVTRTGPAAELLVEGQLPGVLEYLDGMRAAAEEMLGDAPLVCGGQEGATAVMGCIGALLSSRHGIPIGLPLELGSPWAREQWPIS